MNYRNTCSCCGNGISKKQLDFLTKIGEIDSEGNLCTDCYQEQIRQNYYQLAEIRDELVNTFKKPINKFKFKHKPFTEQCNIIFRMMDKGYITWTIGSK